MRYDPFRHALRHQGDSDNLSDTTSYSKVRSCKVYILIDIWRNFAKYHDFSFRLQSVDCGVLLGSVLTVGERIFGKYHVAFDFDDAEVALELGIDTNRERVYAIVCFGTDLRYTPPKTVPTERKRSARPQFEAGFQWSERLLGVHETASARSDLSHATSYPEISPSVFESEVSIVPDKDSEDLFDAILARKSGGLGFLFRPIDVKTIGSIIRFALSDVCNDTFVNRKFSFPWIFVSALNVNGIDPGTYLCEREASSDEISFRKVGNDSGLSEKLSSAIRYPTINTSAVAAFFHVFGDRDFLLKTIGPRGYRIQQMLAGVIASRVETAAHAHGFGSHILLGVDDREVEMLCGKSDSTEISLIQVAVGSCRQEHSLESLIW